MNLRSAQFVWLLLLFGKQADAACPASPAQAADSARRVEAAFISMESSAFARELDVLNEELSCLTAPPDPQQAALVHEALGLATFKDRGRTEGMAYFGAMCSLDSYHVPESVLEFTPVAEWIHAACALPPGGFTPYAINPGYSLVVDGEATLSLPDSRAALALIRGPEGVAWSGLLVPGELPPMGAWNLPLPCGPAGCPSPRPSPLLLGAAAAAAGSGVLWGAFALQRADLIRSQQLINAGASPAEVGRSADDMVSQLALARGLGFGAGVAGGAAIGLVIAARIHSSGEDRRLLVGPGAVSLSW